MMCADVSVWIRPSQMEKYDEKNGKGWKWE